MSFTRYNQKTGFTYIELVVVIVIIAAVSVTGAALMGFFIQNAIFIPRQLNVDMLTSEAMDIMIEGDQQAKGLRFSKRITAMADNQITFRNQDDNVDIIYQLDTLTSKLYRKIGPNPLELIPYYLPPGVTITGNGNVTFSYYDGNDAWINPSLGDPANVRRVGISIIAKTGTGSFNELEGQTELSSSIAVKRY